jgi:hypothetical protein
MQPRLTRGRARQRGLELHGDTANPLVAASAARVPDRACLNRFRPHAGQMTRLDWRSPDIASITRPPFGRHRLLEVRGDGRDHPAMNPFVLIPRHIARLASRASWPFARFKHWLRVKRRAVPAIAPKSLRPIRRSKALVLPHARQDAAPTTRIGGLSRSIATRLAPGADDHLPRQHTGP